MSERRSERGGGGDDVHAYAKGIGDMYVVLACIYERIFFGDVEEHGGKYVA